MKSIEKALFYVFLLSFTVNCGGKNEDQNKGKATTKKSGTFPLAVKGKEIFEGKGTCIACHKLDVKLVGPSIQEIAKIYKEKKISIATFLEGTEEPVIDPAQYEVMKINFELTKNFTDEERQALEQYIFSQGK
ncbi:c-type cytochrome [Flavobacterium sp.]|uniref:c-type cytochrome n=1 Tax=Flavobacterium sp. TaxID=239 RepID=UPI0038D1555A